MAYRKHRATGNPVGRPRILPHDLAEQILAKLKSMENPETGLVQVSWRELISHFGVSRSTIARQLSILKLHRRLRCVYIHDKNDPELVHMFYQPL